MNYLNLPVGTSNDYDEILCYGISFFKKRCMVKKK